MDDKKNNVNEDLQAKQETEKLKQEQAQAEVDRLRVEELAKEELAKAELAKQSQTQKTERKKAIKLADNEEVDVENNTPGVLVYNGSGGMQWLFHKKGDVLPMEIGELRRMRTSQPKFLEKAWIVVRDSEAVEYLRIGHFYKDVLEKDDIDELFEQPVREIEHVIDKSNTNQKIAILHSAREKVASGELNDIRVIKLIDKKFQINLSDELENQDEN